MNTKYVTIGSFIASGIVSLVGLAIIADNRKTKKLYSKLRDSIDNRIEPIEVPKAIIDEAIERRANNVVNRAVSDISDRTLLRLNSDISREAKEAVEGEFKSVKGKIKDTIYNKIELLDFDEIKEEIIEECKESVKDRFKDDLDDILSDYKDQLKSIGQIYKSIAENMKQ